MSRDTFDLGKAAASSFATLACFSALVFLSCSPEDPGPPYSAVVYDYDVEERRYVLRETALPTLYALRGLEGEVTTVLGKVDLAISATARVETEDDLVAAIHVRGGRPADLRWFPRDDGVLVPEDFGSLLLFTYYRNLERCRDFFHEHGVPQDVPGHIRTFHLPTFGTVLLGGFTLISDNAGYASALEAFALFPRQMLMDRLPLAMNLGVVCHEYSHAVFHALVAGDSLVPAGTLAGWPREAENLMRSVDEGFADVFGALVTDDPMFIAPSVPPATAEGRNLSASHRFDTKLRAALEQDSPYDPYPLGTVLAAVVWRVREAAGSEVAARGLVTGMHRLGDVAGPDLDLGVVSAVLYESMPEDGRPSLCEALGAVALPIPAGCR